MKSTLKITGFILILLLSASVSVNAQRGGMGGMYGPVGFVNPVLTEKQKTDMAALATKYRVEMDTLRAQMRRTTEIKKRGDLASKIQILSDTYKSDANKLLTEEQKKSLEPVTGVTAGMRGQVNYNFRGMGPMNNNFAGRGMIMANPIFRGKMLVDSLMNRAFNKVDSLRRAIIPGLGFDRNAPMNNFNGRAPMMGNQPGRGNNNNDYNNRGYNNNNRNGNMNRQR